MCLTANFGAVTHYAKSFATSWLKLLDIFSFLRILQDFFFNQKHMLDIFWGDLHSPPIKNQMVHP